jgi:predicted N-formylglutamate amidohydrolase
MIVRRGCARNVSEKTSTNKAADARGPSDPIARDVADTPSATSQPLLLAPDEPPPFRITEGEDNDWLIVCDHAGNTIPRGLNDLGVAEEDRLDHIGWDIGAAVIARQIASHLRASLIEGVYSRLVIDCNRYPTVANAIPEWADGRRIPGNHALSAADKARRIAAIFDPYHREIASSLNRAIASGARPVLLSIHSCTAVLNGKGRPWHIGIGWTRDSRVSEPLLAMLATYTGLKVGNNEPYGLDLGLDFTVPEHAMVRGLAHLQVEFRNDMLRTEAEAQHLADCFVDALTRLGDRPEWRQRQTYLSTADGLSGYGIAEVLPS